MRHDADADAPLSTWAMIEQRNAALDVAGAAVPAGRAHLELPREPYAFAENDASAQKYLQARGIHPHDGDLEVFETIVEADAALVLAAAADGTLVLTRATNGREPVRVHRVSPPA